MNSDCYQYNNTSKTSGIRDNLVSGEAPSTPSSSLKPATAGSPMPSVSSSSKLSTGESELVPTFEKRIALEITTKFNQLVHVIFIKPLRIKIAVEPSNIVKVATFIRDDLGFDHAESVAGTDYPKDNQIEVIYHLGSYSKIELAGHVLSLTTRTNRDDARLPSLISVYKSVEYHERETFEMLGVYFEGHPRNERFLLPEDWADIPPLRKEFRIKGR
ncbi:MAG TPA: NADH-quinone oxidoreductase subunit C [Candidatus Nitrosopolaris sp.]|nr:NADH-quinone oxidoreductase subunit C [Candidatus Nitrosopolaris sp.]